MFVAQEWLGNDCVRGRQQVRSSVARMSWLKACPNEAQVEEALDNPGVGHWYLSLLSAHTKLLSAGLRLRLATGDGNLLFNFFELTKVEKCCWLRFFLNRCEYFALLPSVFVLVLMTVCSV